MPLFVRRREGGGGNSANPLKECCQRSKPYPPAAAALRTWAAAHEKRPRRRRTHIGVTAAIVRHFQSHHGIAADGIVGRETLRELNVPAVHAHAVLRRAHRRGDRESVVERAGQHRGEGALAGELRDPSYFAREHISSRPLRTRCGVGRGAAVITLIRDDRRRAMNGGGQSCSSGGAS